MNIPASERSPRGGGRGTGRAKGGVTQRRARRADKIPALPPAVSGRVEQAAACLQADAVSAGVELPASFAHRVAAAGLVREPNVGLSPLGTGVVIHTVPATTKRLPVVVGYADSRGQWYWDGKRHVERPGTGADGHEMGQVDR